MLPSDTGWFGDHNISWSVPAARLGYLYGYTPDATSQTAWQALTVSGKTLYTNYIQSSSYVKVQETPPTGAVKIMPSLSAVALGNAVRISAVRKVGLSG
jgi:hypothetical protein